MKRGELASLIVEKLNHQKEELKFKFKENGKVNSFIVDNLLPEDLCRKVYQAFPSPSEMKQKKSLREYKNIAAQMDQYDPILEETIYAFQDPKVVSVVEEITGLQKLEPDENLYAGGLSLMSKGNFLNPHLDNSHDKDREKYRVLNLLYYVTPDWEIEYGGNLELWDDGMSGEPREIHSKFNRLVVMVTNKTSYHSVNKVVYDGNRCCVSNYYFSDIPAENSNYFHVTTFYGRPKEFAKKIILAADATIRQGLRLVFRRGVRENPHVYKKDNAN